jgi:hypothetical protein
MHIFSRHVDGARMLAVGIEFASNWSYIVKDESGALKKC